MGASKICVAIIGVRFDGQPYSVSAYLDQVDSPGIWNARNCSKGSGERLRLSA